jgi:UBX domain-containing protein 7
MCENENISFVQLKILPLSFQYDVSADGQTYAQRYQVHDYPHVGIIDPRTGRLLWKKEGWTQENPLTAESFAEMAMDFCSRHSFDKEPQAPRPAGANTSGSNNGERKRPFMSEQEQVQAAMEASLKRDAAESADANNDDDDDDDDDEYDMEDDGEEEIECLGTEEEMKQAAEPTFLDQLVGMTVPDEPSGAGARVQLRMPDGKRLVRKFAGADNVRTIYAFVAVSAFVVSLVQPFARKYI